MVCSRIYLNEMKSRTGRKHLCKGVALNVCVEDTKEKTGWVRNRIVKSEDF